MRSVTPVSILLIDDNPGDVELTQEALADCKFCNPLHIARDGLEGLEFLRKHKNDLPDVILLDLNMPRMDGKELLGVLKSDSDMKAIPVVILTSSDAEQDVVKSYNLHANCYIVKPVMFDRFVEVVKAIEGFWFGIVKLPKKA